MNWMNRIALGVVVVTGSLGIQSAVAEIHVLGDDSRDVEIIIERSGPDGETIREIISGGGHVIENDTDAGHLVRVEVIEDNDDGVPETRTCIVDDDGAIECTGENQFTRHHRASVDDMRERAMAMAHAARAEAMAEARGHGDRAPEERIERRHVIRLHENEGNELHEMHAMHRAHDMHGGHEGHATTRRDIARMDMEITQLRAELRELQAQLHALNGRAGSRSHRVAPHADEHGARMNELHEFRMADEGNVEIQIEVDENGQTRVTRNGEEFELETTNDEGMIWITREHSSAPSDTEVEQEFSFVLAPGEASEEVVGGDYEVFVERSENGEVEVTVNPKAEGKTHLEREDDTALSMDKAFTKG